MNQPLPPIGENRTHLRTAASFQQEDAQKLARILIEVGEPAPTRVGHATAGGDERRLRGIPAIGRGVSGAIQDTAPHLHDASV